MKKSKEALKHYESYCRSRDYYLSDVYGRYSQAKANAWEYCERLAQENEGSGLKVVSHNLNVFTAGFEFMKDGELCYCHITPSKDIYYPIEQ